MDEGLAEFTIIDSHIEETIDDLIVDSRVKDALKVEYQKRIKADEEGYLKKWDITKKGLIERPERETGSSKIVIENDRVYAKCRYDRNKVPKTTNEV